MRKARRFAPGLVLAALATGLGSTAPADDPKGGEAIRLFNGKDLEGWTIYVNHKDKAIDKRSDPKGVFRVEDGVIHVSGEEFGGLTTRDEYENYRLTVEFKWGEKRWPPREQAPRDSGILVHCNGPDKVWTKSIECQIQEHDCGDFWLVDGTSIVVDGLRYPDKEANRPNRVVKAEDAEKPRGEWNTIEVVCDGGKITNIVNGEVVNAGAHASVTKGRILLQSEGAEVYYRKVELTPLKR